MTTEHIPGPPTLDPLAMSGCTTTYGQRRIGDLTAAAYNPRSMSASERESLIRSLETWGFVDPLVVRDEDGLIIGGHQRLDAWRLFLSRKGVSDADVLDRQVPVMAVRGLSDERAKLLNMALNRISGEWDHSKLAALLSELSATLEAPELELSGFKLPEIEDYKHLLTGSPIVPGAAGSAPNTGAGGGSGGGGGGDSPPDPKDAPPEVTAEDVAAAAARRIVVEFATGPEALEAQDILRRFGMTGDKDAPAALLAALRTAAAILDGETPPAVPTPAAPKGKRKKTVSASA